jgi:hypothetical protein
MKSANAKEAKVAAEQRSADIEQQEYESQRAARSAESEALRQQQAEMFELQRRSVAAQEEAAKAQSEAVDDQRRQYYMNQFNKNIEKMTGTGAYAPPPPRAPIQCYTNGNYTNCN